MILCYITKERRIRCAKMMLSHDFNSFIWKLCQLLTFIKRCIIDVQVGVKPNKLHTAAYIACTGQVGYR